MHTANAVHFRVFSDFVFCVWGFSLFYAWWHIVMRTDRDPWRLPSAIAQRGTVTGWHIVMRTNRDPWWLPSAIAQRGTVTGWHIVMRTDRDPWWLPSAIAQRGTVTGWHIVMRTDRDPWWLPSAIAQRGTVCCFIQKRMAKWKMDKAFLKFDDTCFL